MIIIVLCGYVLSFIICQLLFISIFYVTLTLYEKIDKDKVKLSIITGSAHCSLSSAFPYQW
jgi:hypothetical protein